MSLPFSHVSVFADDIRQESGGALSLVGILPDNVSVPSVPGMIPKIGLYTRVHVPVDQTPGEITIWLRFPDGSEQQLNALSTELINETRKLSLEQGTQYYGLVSQAMAAPFPVNEAGPISVILKCDGAEQVSGVLRLVVEQ